MRPLAAITLFLLGLVAGSLIESALLAIKSPTDPASLYVVIARQAERSAQEAERTRAAVEGLATALGCVSEKYE